MIMQEKPKLCPNLTRIQVDKKKLTEYWVDVTKFTAKHWQIIPKTEL